MRRSRASPRSATSRHHDLGSRCAAIEPWGPAALGISAFSPTLRAWTQGGPVAIHGTSDPGSVGRAESHGCLRVKNDLMLKLYAATRAGTPVLIHR